MKWNVGGNPGVLRDPEAVTIINPIQLGTFRGCWIRYPLVSDLPQFGNPKRISQLLVNFCRWAAFSSVEKCFASHSGKVPLEIRGGCSVELGKLIQLEARKPGSTSNWNNPIVSVK